MMNDPYAYRNDYLVDWYLKGHMIVRGKPPVERPVVIPQTRDTDEVLGYAMRCLDPVWHYPRFSNTEQFWKAVFALHHPNQEMLLNITYTINPYAFYEAYTRSVHPRFDGDAKGYIDKTRLLEYYKQQVLEDIK